MVNLVHYVCLINFGPVALAQIQLPNMGRPGFWGDIRCNSNNHDDDMKYNGYYIFRKIHLYASLSIVVLLLMYVVSSYLMIH